MLDVLKTALEELPVLLKHERDWNSLRVDYNHPYVDRLWRQFDDDHRLLLHRLHPCESDEALFHPHPWPSIIEVMGPGGYETGIGYGDPTGDPPPIAATFLLKNQAIYAMLEKDTWHYVRPLSQPVYSVMIVGPSFDTPKQERFGQMRDHKPLDAETRSDLFKKWRWFFSVTG